nr:VWA domain-containing protein [Streptomyces abyssomicinicus]
MDELVRRSAAWLNLGVGPSGRHTATVVADFFDRIAWRDTLAQSAALRELADELRSQHDHADDLLADVFLAAYREAEPRLREPSEMDPARLADHGIVTALVRSADFAELRRETAGDPYAAAMAVLAQASALRRMLVRNWEARERAARAGGALRDARDAADRVGEGLRRAAAMAGADGTVPGPVATAVRRAVGAAEAAEATAREARRAAARAVSAAAADITAMARHATAGAATAVRHEAALQRAWGIGRGELERMPFEERDRLAERLRGGRLARWAELIGRFREMAGGERARRVENTTGELVGVTVGDDLSRVLPSELAHLGLPGLRAVFAARYAAGELMLHDSQGERSTGKGAVIACVDTSHSMYAEGPGGVTREAWSKACALALLDQARAAGRDFVGILFSTADQLRVFRFPAGRPAATAEVVGFAETFLGGGTDFQRPLSAAADLLAEEFDAAGRQRGDIVLITDDACEVTEEWTRAWRAAKRRLGFRLFGVAVGGPADTGHGSVLEALCDNLRTVEDLADVHAAADLFRLV